MNVVELWRYPVKSMGGERLSSCSITSVGIDGDRRWGVVDRETGRVLTARREPRLLFASARLVAPEAVEIVLPDGEVLAGGDALTHWLGRPVSLQRAGDAGGIYENPRNFENESDWVSWQGPPGAWHDMKRARVSLVSTTTLGGWDVRRFRPNVVLSGSNEDALVGCTVRLGSSILSITKQIDRCIMVSRPQPGLEADLDVLRTINRERKTFLAIGALISAPGTIMLGDALTQLAQAKAEELRAP